MKCLRRSGVVIAVILMFLLSGCLISEPAAKKSFENMMNAFKACDSETIDDYYSFNAVTNYIDEATGEEYQEAILSTLTKMDYKVISADSTGENAVTITADITTVDFSEIVESYINKVMELVESREYQLKVSTMTEDEYKTIMAEKMLEAIDESDGERVTKRLEATMIKSGSDWVLGGDADVFLGALFADMSNAVESLT